MEERIMYFYTTETHVFKTHFLSNKFNFSKFVYYIFSITILK